MNNTIRKTGLYAALSVIILILIFILTMIIFPSVGFVSAKAYISELKITRIIPAIPSFLLVLANIPLFAALYFYADTEKKIYGLTGIIFGAGYMVCSGINYYLQISMHLRNIYINNDLLTEIFLMNNPDSFSYAADNLGYTFLSLAFIAFSGIFNRRGIHSWIKTFSILFGISGLMGSAGYILNYPLLENMVLISALPYLVCVILLLFEFKRIKKFE